MKRILLFLSVVLSAVAQAQIAKNDWSLAKGKLTYHVSFPLKNVEGVSESVKGKGKCDDKTCDFLIASPVKSFESGDGNRDNHMLEVTKAGPNPMVAVRMQVPKNSPAASFTAPAEITFGGVTHTYQVGVKSRTEGKSTIVSGTVPLKLSDFKMERPSLLGVKIKDETPVDFELNWE